MNQREFTRVRTAIPVDVELAGQTLAGTTKDVSLSGCHVTGASSPPEDTPCRITLYIDGRDGAIKVVAKGIVARLLRDGFGVQFLELIEVESYEHLRNVVLYNADDPGKAEHELEGHLGLKRRDVKPTPAD